VQDKILFTLCLHVRWWCLADIVSITWHLLWCNVCCSVLQCVAVCRSVLQCVAVAHGFLGSNGVKVLTRPSMRHQAADLCSHVTYSHESCRRFRFQDAEFCIPNTLCSLCLPKQTITEYGALRIQIKRRGGTRSAAPVYRYPYINIYMYV